MDVFWFCICNAGTESSSPHCLVGICDNPYPRRVDIARVGMSSLVQPRWTSEARVDIIDVTIRPRSVARSPEMSPFCPIRCHHSTLGCHHSDRDVTLLTSGCQA